MTLGIEIEGVGVVAAKVAHIRSRGAAIALQPSEDQRQRIVAKLHTKAGKHGTLRIDVGGIASGFWRRMVRPIP